MQNPGETERDGVEAIHEELEAAGYEHARENVHGEDCGGPRSPCGPCRSTEEADEGKDGDEEREWGQTDARRAQRSTSRHCRCPPRASEFMSVRTYFIRRKKQMKVEANENRTAL